LYLEGGPSSSSGGFRPISLLRYVYASRKGSGTDTSASYGGDHFTQLVHSLSKGMNLVDDVVVVNEIIDSAKNTKKDWLIFKMVSKSL